MRKGLFITFEGGEGAGKTTLIDKLALAFQDRGQNILKTRAPGGTVLGQEIRQLLLHKQGTPLSLRCELLLFLADRAQHVDEVILPALNAGKIVLCDRFNDSTMAYQGARGFAKGQLERLCRFASSDLVPDLTIYLDLDPKIGFERNQRAGFTKDRIESETLKFHQKIRRAFQQIAKKEPERLMLIDASRTPEEILKEAKEKIDALFHARR